MALENSIATLTDTVDRLSTLIAQLIDQLEAGRSASQAPKPAPTPPAETKAAAPAPATVSPSEGKSSAGATKPSSTSTPPSDTGASTGLDYVKDVAPRFSLLVAKDRPAAVAMIHKYKPTAKKLLEAITPDQYADVLAEINALLED